MLKKSLILLILLFLLIPFSLFASDYSVPVRTPENIIIGSYNIKWFGQIEHDLDKLAMVIQHFDVCSVIEVKDEKQLANLASALEKLTGRNWSYIHGFKTNRPEGSYFESFAVFWRTDRVSIGNGLISNIFDPAETYRNDPYAVSFRSGNFDFMLLVIHTRWSEDEYGSRAEEIAGIHSVIKSIKEMSYERDIIIMGDFNYSGGSPVLRQMAEELSYAQVDPNLKTTFKNDYSDYSSAYDHIYISESFTKEFIEGQSGFIDSTALVYGETSPASMKLSKNELSDHLPVWAAFSVTEPDDD